MQGSEGKIQGTGVVYKVLAGKVQCTGKGQGSVVKCWCKVQDQVVKHKVQV